jgi:transposase
MMGSKARIFTPLVALSLDELVPADHFYRHLDRVLDLSFVRDLVQDCYAVGIGRPSVDPVVFFRLQLVMFFEGIRSERLLMRTVADRLSVRWFLGYNLDEPLPDHSSLTRVRARYGLDVFRRFFAAIVEQCQQAGLVWGRELYFDATHVLANASMDLLVPRFAVEARAALVAVKLGDQGLYLGTTADPSRWEGLAPRIPALAEAQWHGRSVLMPCFEVDIAGTTGSGDATIAGFLMGLLEHGTLAETLEAAVAVGACSVERVDATSGIPTWEQVQKRLVAGWTRSPVQVALPDWTYMSETGTWHGPRDRR